MEIPSCVTLQRLPSEIQTKDPKHWNALIKHYTKLKNDHAILTTHIQMESLGVSPDYSTLHLVLKACTRLKAIDSGKKIHFRLRNTKLIQDVRVRTALVDFYCKCGFLEDALRVFNEMSQRDVVLWNTMISGYAGRGHHKEAIWLFMEMERENLTPGSGTMVALLLACGELLELNMGKEVHGYCLRTGLLDVDPRVATALMGFYLRFDISDSRLVFDSMFSRNVVSWNAMLSGYFDVGDCSKALKLFEKMLVDRIELDSVTMLVVIQACAECGSLKLGMQIHQLVIKFQFDNDLFVVNALLNMYSRNGSLKISYELFKSLTIRDTALWNSMISAYIDFGCHAEAMDLFIRMQKEGSRVDERTIVIMSSLCTELANGLQVGKSLHAHVIKSGMKIDTFLGNAFLSLYAELNCVEAVQKVFSEIRGLDVVSWNTLILALATNSLTDQAWEHFGRMQESLIKPNSYTMVSILAACEDETWLNIGRSIHGYVIKHSIEMNASLNTALMDMYMNCGDEATSRNLFEGCPDKDLISWNALIASYIKNSQSQSAVLLFNRMILELEPNSVTIKSVLSACTHLANLPQGQCLHAYILRRDNSLSFDLSLANALITMYARCGSMQNAEIIFKTLPTRDTISWNAIIACYGAHGHGSDALLAFSEMVEGDFKPNGVTFVSLLSACSHSGLIDQGLQLFYSMVQDFGITPELNHYGCVVDLLGRGGRLNEASEFINSMPIKPDASIWRALLTACQDSCDIKLAETIFANLVELEPMNAGNYVLLSNIYAAAGLWLKVKQVRTWLKENGLKKSPGISWIVVKSYAHCFTAGDKLHPQSDKIYSKLSSLLSLMKEAGYFPDLYWVSHEED